jgi:hypothetical protein
MYYAYFVYLNFYNFIILYQTNMPEYISHSIDLSKAQAKNLSQGGSIRLKHSSLSGPHGIHLTKLQMRKLIKAHKSGKGCCLSMSPSQLKANAQKGAGWLDVLKSIGRVAGPILQTVAPLLGSYGAPAAVAGNVITGLSGEGIKKARKKGGSIRSKLSEYLE